MKFLVSGMALVLLLPACSMHGDVSQSLEIDDQTQLMVDDHVIESTAGLRRHLNPLVKDPRNPIFRPERPWEGQYTIPREVLYDEAAGLYKMWYSCLAEDTGAGVRINRTAYAVSRDGITWDRPELGLVEFQGSKRNNLIHGNRTADQQWDVFGEKVQDGKVRQVFGNGPKIILDEHETDPSRRFKALTYGRIGPGAEAGVCIGFSPDGLSWTPSTLNPVLTGTGDTHWMFGWDDAVGRYVAFIRPSQKFRTIGRSESLDFEQWSPPVEVLAPDDQDQPGTQFYGMPVFKDRGVYFGMICVYHPNSLLRDVQLAFSRDGIQWERAGNRHPILTYGLPDEFDSHQLMALRPIVVGDEIRVFYMGENEAHALTSSDLRLQAHEVRRHPSKQEQSWLKRRQGFGALAVSRRDGFVSLDAGPDAGEMVTRPFVLGGSRLEVNADAEEGEVKVEIQDESGMPLAGFTLEDSVAVRSDSVRHNIGWKSGSDLSSLQEKTVKLRFVLTEAKLFSFTVQP